MLNAPRGRDPCKTAGKTATDLRRQATSRPWAPWYAIPADHKPWMRLQVAQIVRDTLQSLDLHYPEVDPSEQARFDEMRNLLENE